MIPECLYESRKDKEAISLAVGEPETKAPVERRIELDIAKGIAVLTMVCVHVVAVFSNESVSESAFGLAWENIATFPAAPLFMLAMGTGLVYSRRQTAEYAFKRGALLLVAAYVLNALRGFIPISLGLMIGRFAEESLWYEPIMSFLEVDILAFAGLSLILVGVLRALSVPWAAYPVVGVAIGSVHYLVRGITVGNPVADSLLSLLWAAGENCYFPFVSWVLFPLAGVAFGTLLRRSKDTRRFYLWSIVIGAVAFLGSAWIVDFEFGRYFFDQPADYDYYHLDLVGQVYHLGLALMWLALIYLIREALPAVASNRLQFWSKNLTTIYFVHWVILGWLYLPLGINELGLWPTILMMPVMLIVSDRIVTYLPALTKLGLPGAKARPGV